MSQVTLEASGCWCRLCSELSESDTALSLSLSSPLSPPLSPLFLSLDIVRPLVDVNLTVELGRA